MTVTPGSSYTLPECTFTAPANKQFDAWDAGKPGDSITVSADLTLTALWADIPAESCAITFAPNGGSGAMEPVTVTPGSSYTLPECTFTAPANKQFDAWDAGKPGDSITVSADLTITALWKSAEVVETVAAPVLPESASFSGEITIRIACETEGASIYYTTDGSTPTEESTLYTGAFVLSQTAMVKAVAVKAGMESSEVVSAAYTRKSSGSGVIVNPYSSHPITVKEAEHGSGEVSSNRAMQGETITLRVTPEEGWQLAAVAAADNIGRQLRLTRTGDGVYTFEMGSYAVTITLTFTETVSEPQPEPEPEPEPGPEPEQVNPFMDVAEGTYYYDAVLWAVRQGITQGVDDTHFDPIADCTRAQLVTFLWRAAGMPEPGAVDCSFVDLDEEAYYYKAVLWAIPQGITQGVDDTHFSPFADCTRAQVVTFLWRAAGMPEPGAVDCSFVDLDEEAYYYEAVLWAVRQGITQGVDNTHFAPDAVLDRAQIVTFLYRAYGDK